MKCKICDNIIKEKIFSKNIIEKKLTFDYYFCNNCNCLFSDGMDNFTNEEFSNWYKYPEYLKYDKAGNSDYRRYRMVRERELIAPESKKILAHGAGATMIEDIFANMGLDIYSTYSEHANSLKIEDLPKEYFELIIANEVMEHWANPYYEFELINKLLSSHGIFIGTTGITNNQLKKGKLEDWIYLNYDCLHAGHIMLWSWEAIDILSKKYNLLNKSMQGTNSFRSNMHVGITQAFVILEKP